MRFEWDDEKEKYNIRTHGLDFTTAARVFDDENRLELYDEAHSEYEDRYQTIGIIDDIMIVAFVVYTERDNDTIRLISARRATKKERDMYDDYSKGY